MVQKYMKMKNTTDSQENLFILRKSLGMVSIPIIHRNASRIDWGNSFILNNFSLPMFHKLFAKQIDLQFPLPELVLLIEDLKHPS